MLDLIKRLCEVNGISGREDKVRELIIKEVEPFADEITVDPLGNLCVFKKGVSRAKNRVMLDAHMDEVGFIITSVTSDGNLRFECVGGISSAVMLGRHVFVGEILLKCHDFRGQNPLKCQTLYILLPGFLVKH